MKTHHSFIAASAGLVIAIGAGFGLTNVRSAEASSKEVTFARPNLAAAAVAAPEVRKAVDLTMFSALADPKALKEISRDVEACHQALAAASVSFVEAAPEREGKCGFDEAVKIKSSLADWSPNPGAPKDLPMTCNLAAKLHLWERHVVIPAAEKYLGSPVKDIKVFGTFQCRTVAGHDRLSEHSFAKAIDVAAFELADGRMISVLEDYRSTGAKGDFLREIHTRACDLFDVTLGPDYNADHENHFHLDVGGQHACR